MFCDKHENIGDCIDCLEEKYEDRIGELERENKAYSITVANLEKKLEEAKADSVKFVEKMDLIKPMAADMLVGALLPCIEDLIKFKTKQILEEVKSQYADKLEKDGEA